jgi:hypothetical protein
MAAEKTTAFVYLLLRDHLPAGVVTRLVGEAQMSATIEYGNTELGALAYRLADLLEDDDAAAKQPAGDDERTAGVLQAIEVGDDGGYNTVAEEEFISDEMVDWLDLFDDRLRQSPHFVAAVNEAAAAGRETDEETAALVADRVRELKAQAEAAAAADRGGD